MYKRIMCEHGEHISTIVSFYCFFSENEKKIVCSHNQAFFMYFCQSIFLNCIYRYDLAPASKSRNEKYNEINV